MKFWPTDGKQVCYSTCYDPKCPKGNYKLKVDFAINVLLVRCVSENEITSLSTDFIRLHNIVVWIIVALPIHIVPVYIRIISY